MAQKLVIVESPAKAKTIGKFLGKGYKIIASNGHVRDLPKSQLGVDVEHGFKPKYITLRGRGDILERIRKEAKSADKVYLATDPDREGEAISWHLAQVLNMDVNEPCRIAFNEITPSVVKNAVKKPRSIDMNLVNAQQTRRILDRLVGYKISPLLWAKVKKGLSAGRVQSVAMRIVCDREREIERFVPEEYWSLTALLKDASGKKKFEAKFFGKDKKSIPLTNEAQVMEIIAQLEGADYIAEEVKKGEKFKHAPAPFTTSNLQQEASRKLNFTTKKTMLIAQQLYEGIDIAGMGAAGLVTYIRTDSVRVSKEAQDEALKFIRTTYGDKYVPSKPNIYKGRRDAQDAHEAIRPTSIELSPKRIKESLSNEQYKLYKLIYDRFMASQMKEQHLETLTVNILANGYTFRANGSRVLSDGFTTVYIEGRDDDSDENGVNLPDIKEGDRLGFEKLNKEQRFTQPPPRYTEASLVKELEEKGIGRPSTYAPTISTIIERGYVRREKKLLTPTELGFIVTDLMVSNFPDIMDVEFTANMEKRLDEVEENKTEPNDILSDFYTPFMVTLETAQQKIDKIKLKDEVSDVPCDKCGAMMVYKLGRFGKFLACPNFPECRNTKTITETIDVLCPKCGSKLIKRRSKKGRRVFYGCEKYPECDFISWDMPTNEKCPECGGPLVQKTIGGKATLVCMNKDCKHSEPKSKKEKA